MLHIPIFSRSPLHRLLLVAAASALVVPSAVRAQVKTSVLDRAKQDATRRDAVINADRFGVIDGVVTDTLDQPLTSAEVAVVGTTARVVTGENGRFRMLQVPPGQYLLVVRRIGFAPASGIIEVPAADTLRLAYTLTRSSAMLDTVKTFERRVSLRMVEFEQRRAQGAGQFVTREEIERRGSLQVYDFLRNMRTIEVSRITDQMFGGMVALSRREAGSVLGEGAGACPMQVFLDGIVLPRFFNLELLPPPKQIAGIEVYSGAASIPPQFGGPDRRCGVVAVWTRDGN
ncbi:carboxypeptidase regulatory-like domain-containing protein [Gemmatimonas sp.]|jgi:hypothetical protein|uniref:TonB-dependent receptor n=1 Tax=Gemmatimonas sp. TaxID=1962908 RepID=UPI00391C81B4